MIYETSLLDPEEGIRFRGYSIPELQEQLPKARVVYCSATGASSVKNMAYMVRLGWGKRTIATPKLRNGAVAIGWKYAFGPSLSLTKPVYLEIGYPDIPYSYVLIECYDPTIHGTDDIYGRAGALNGILELTPQPGAFARVAVDFEYGAGREYLRTASVGVNLDAFLTPVEIMAASTGQNDRLFLTLFVHWSFGRQQFKT